MGNEGGRRGWDEEKNRIVVVGPQAPRDGDKKQLLTRREQRAKTHLSLFEIFSFLTFGLLCTFATLAFLPFFWLFAGLLVLDGVATLFQVDTVLSFDRTIFFLGLVLLSAVQTSYAVVFLTFEILLLFVALDFSLFLRKLGDTRVDLSVLKGRLRSYAYTVLPAFLLTYVLFSLFSSAPIAVPAETAMVTLGVSSAGVFIALYIIIHYITSLEESTRSFQRVT